MGCIADLFNLSLNEYHSLIEKGVQRALDTGKLDINSGMAVSDMVDIARTIWNQENPDKKVMSFRIPYADPNLKLALERGHSLVTAYRG